MHVISVPSMTRRVIAYDGVGGADGSRTRAGRLEHAALELFAEQGFAATTVPEITARAGLTTRTFFRHFADKREVFFAGDEISAFAGRLLAEAPADLDPVAPPGAGACARRPRPGSTDAGRRSAGAAT